MISLVNGFPQNVSGLIVPNGSVTFQLNTDATVIAAPGGFVAATAEVVFQFNSVGEIQPNPPAAAAQIYSNAELNPQNANGLGTYYLVTFYDANGARINANPMWWQFPEAAGTTVDISQITPFATVGGNVIFYPTQFTAVPGGANFDIQVNKNGALYGDNNFTWDYTTQIFNTIGTGQFTVPGPTAAALVLTGNAAQTSYVGDFNAGGSIVTPQAGFTFRGLGLPVSGGIGANVLVHIAQNVGVLESNTPVVPLRISTADTEQSVTDFYLSASVFKLTTYSAGTSGSYARLILNGSGSGSATIETTYEGSSGVFAVTLAGQSDSLAIFAPGGGDGEQLGAINLGTSEGPWGALYLSGVANVGGLLQPLTTPASSTAPGAQGAMEWDANYIYVCVATNTWLRTPLFSFVTPSGPFVSDGFSTQSSAYTLQSTDAWVNVTGATTITIPHAISGHRWLVFNADPTNTVTLQMDSGNINNGAGVSLLPNTGSEVISDGTNGWAK